MENLMNGLCPECNSSIYFDKTNNIYSCSCGWKMTKEDLDFLIMVKQEQENEYKVNEVDENLSELNNLRL
jgi:hypothetical protein